MAWAAGGAARPRFGHAGNNKNGVPQGTPFFFLTLRLPSLALPPRARQRPGGHQICHQGFSRAFTPVLPG